MKSPSIQHIFLLAARILKHVVGTESAKVDPFTPPGGATASDSSAPGAPTSRVSDAIPLDLSGDGNACTDVSATGDID
jgi:hypothetical protein